MSKQGLQAPGKPAVYKESIVKQLNEAGYAAAGIDLQGKDQNTLTARVACCSIVALSIGSIQLRLLSSFQQAVVTLMGSDAMWTDTRTTWMMSWHSQGEADLPSQCHAAGKPENF